MTNAVPFRVRCKLCNTVAESWHWSQVPEGHVEGLASCQCGKVKADSLGVGAGKGRILTSEPEDNWEVLTD